MYQYFKIQLKTPLLILIHVDFNLMSSVQLSALVGK